MLFFILFDFVKFQRRKRRFKFQVWLRQVSGFKALRAGFKFQRRKRRFRFGYAELKVQEIL